MNNSKETRLSGTPQKMQKLSEAQVVIGAFGTEPDCIGIVEKIDNTTNGIFTRYLGCNYVFKGHPYIVIVEAIGVPKKILSGFFVLLSSRIIMVFLGLNAFLFMLLPKFLKREILVYFWEYFLNVSYKALERWVLPFEKYCIAAKEVYRAMDAIAKKIPGEEMRKRVERTIPVVCMMLEYDFAYRARFQDVLPYLDKRKLRDNPLKEIRRILSILTTREVGGMAPKWKKAGKLLSFLKFVFGKEFEKWSIKFFNELNLDKIKTDEADWYYSLKRKDYNYGGLSYEDRLKIKNELDRKVGNKQINIKIVSPEELKQIENGKNSKIAKS